MFPFCVSDMFLGMFLGCLETSKFFNVFNERNIEKHLWRRGLRLALRLQGTIKDEPPCAVTVGNQVTE